VNDDSFLYQRILPDGRHVAVVTLTYGRARLTIGTDWLQYSHGY
jgi:hypothetical protein